MRRVALTILALAMVSSLLAGQAVASSGGVVIDPRSPTGTEYAVPLDQARADAVGHGDAGRAQGTQSDAPLFGEGVGRDPGSSGASASSGSSTGKRPEASNGDRTRGSSTSGGGAKRVPEPAVPLSRAAAAAGSSSGSALTEPLLAGILVLLLGVGAGAVLRRSRTKSASS